MKGVWLLSWRHVLHNRVQTLILTLCIAVPVYIPVTIFLLSQQYESALTARAEQTPLVAGMRGNRFDLTLAALYFRDSELEPIPYSVAVELNREGRAVAIPLHVRYAARGHPIVGTSAEYYGFRGLRAARGTVPLQLGDCALGADVAAALALEPGGKLFSDQKEVYDISKPPALKMSVCGVLERTGTPDDDAVFVDVKTAWILEGIAHGHDDVKTVDPSYVLREAGGRVAVSQALIEYNEVTPENIDTFHYHGDPSTLPLTAIVVVPEDRKWGTILKARMNQNTADRRMLSPRDVIDDLLGFVFRIRAVFLAITAVLGVCTALMTALVLLLSAKIRAPEMLTLNRIGCSRGTVARLYAFQIGIIVAFSLLLAGLGVWLTWLLLPDLVRSL